MPAEDLYSEYKEFENDDSVFDSEKNKFVSKGQNLNHLCRILEVFTLELSHRNLMK